MGFVYLYETELKKPLAIALSGMGRGLRERDYGSIVQYKTNQNFHYNTPPV
jgi:hypothetical protein